MLFMLVCLFAILLLLALGLTVYFFSLRQKTPLGRCISALLLSSMLTLFFYALATFVHFPLPSRLFFSLFFCANLTNCFFLFRFSMCYAGLTPPRLFFGFCYVLMAVDMCLLLSNVFTQTFAAFSTVQFLDASLWIFRQSVYFYPHLLLCYLFSLGFLGVMLMRTLRTSRLYRIKYLLVLAIFLLGSLSNYIFLSQGLLFDWVSVWFVVMAVFLYFFTYTYLPRRLSFRMGHLYIEKTNSAIFLYDLDGLCLYHNSAAARLFPTGVPDTFSALSEFFGFDPKRTEELQELSLPKTPPVYYEIECQTLLDRDGSYEGCYVVVDDVTREHEAVAQRLYQLSHDSLTGLYNASGFYDAISQTLSLHPRMEFSLITTNVRQFKILNEVMGREMGDVLLKTIARVMQALPSQEQLLLARLESDKFALLAPSSFDVEQELSENISHAFYELYTEHSLSLSPINHCGVYPITDRSVSPIAMCDRANMAILSIEDNMGSAIAYYDSNMRDNMIWESQLLSDFPNALEKEQFVLYYQPQIDSFTNRIVGAEALVRWQHPTQGLLSPHTFIPLLEEKGLIFQLDKYVWQRAAQELRQLRSEGFDVSISVNISPRDIYAGNIRQFFLSLVSDNQLAPENLRLEITETAISLDSEKFIRFITEAQHSGFTVEMDDFGSGYSSLNLLKDIPLDVLKMDMRFLDDCQHSSRGQAIMRTIADLSRALGVPLIAEGVEHQHQVDYLASIGCRNLQGYFYAKPLPLHRFRKMLQNYETGPLL